MANQRDAEKETSATTEVLETKSKLNIEGGLSLFENVSLKKFFPSSKEVEEMSLHEFEAWIEGAKIKISERELERNPLFHLKKQISQILNDSTMPDSKKENLIFKLIKLYMDFINRQHQQVKPT